MLKGKTIQETVTELLRQSREKSDYVAPRGAVKLVYGGASVAAANGAEVLGDILDRRQDRQAEKAAEFGADLGGAIGVLPISNYAHGQLAERVGIPKRYYDRCRERAPKLLVEQANHWLQDEEGPKDHLIRTLDGRVRAFLSAGYRPIDNIDIANTLLPLFVESGLEIVASEVTESRLYLQALSPRLLADVKVGDTVQGGITIKNSEVGAGAFDVQQFLFRLVCLNGLARQSLLRKAHIGHDAGLDAEASRYIKSETQQLRDAALFATVRDVVGGYLGGDTFEQQVNVLRAADGVPIVGKLDDVAQAVATKLELTKPEGSALLEHLARGGSFTKWGVVNAVTALAHDAKDFDRNIELQEAGGRVLDFTVKEWDALQKAA